MSDRVINEEMKIVFEGVTSEVVTWLRSDFPNCVGPYLISVDPDRVILTVPEYLEWAS